LIGDAAMPAFIHHHEAKAPAMVCPNCAVVPMRIKAVGPQWRIAKVTLTYECADCGAEVTELLRTPELLH
jgi:hypothetical protein